MKDLILLVKDNTVVDGILENVDIAYADFDDDTKTAMRLVETISIDETKFTAFAVFNDEGIQLNEEGNPVVFYDFLLAESYVKNAPLIIVPFQYHDGVKMYNMNESKTEVADVVLFNQMRSEINRITRSWREISLESEKEAKKAMYFSFFIHDVDWDGRGDYEAYIERTMDNFLVDVMSKIKKINVDLTAEYTFIKFKHFTLKIGL